MSPSDLNALAIAQFLSTHPDFFQQHRDLFSELRVPHPYESRVISLSERQILGLRDKNRELERQLHTLLDNAKANQRIADQIQGWACSILAEKDATKLPTLIPESLTRIFALETIFLQCWGELTPAHDTDPLQHYTQSLNLPYCGLPPPEVRSLMPEHIQSVAVIPLHHPVSQRHSGVLILGSNSTTRFVANQGTEFLLNIGQLCAAALSKAWV